MGVIPNRPVRAWITTDDEPGELLCFPVFYPDGYQHALLGAIEALIYAENWETVGTTEAQDVADAFTNAYAKTIQGGWCMVPSGTIISYAGGTIPDGYLLCDGSQFNTTDYPSLFNALGYTWGGSGTVFNVPDLVGRFVVGVGGSFSLADSGGESQHTLTESEIPAHNHSIPGTVTTLNELPVGTTPVLTPFALNNQTGSTGGGNPHNNLPPYKALVYLVKT